jgi:catechol 2,3-dioxygenase-like lactoylglutathione lyase family enzyme
LAVLAPQQRRIRRREIVQRGTEGPPLGVDLDAGVALVPGQAPRAGVGGRRYRPGMGLVISNLAVDCTEPRALAAWWAEALGWQIVEDPQADADDDEVGIAPADGSATNLLFLRVPEAKSVKNRLHLDVRPPHGSDWETELARLLEIGARPVDVGQGPEVPWVVLVDPEGNEFCLLRGAAGEPEASEN